MEGCRFRQTIAFFACKLPPLSRYILILLVFVSVSKWCELLGRSVSTSLDKMGEQAAGIHRFATEAV